MPPAPLDKVLVTRDLPGPALVRLGGEVTLVRCPDDPPGAAQVLDRIGDCDGLLCTLTETVDEALLEAAPKLRVVSSVSVGVDHVDVPALTRRGIPLGHTPGVLVDATADLAFALLLSAARRLPEGERFVREGRWTPERRWDPKFLLGRDLKGATLGLVGLGEVGQAVARRAQGFGMRVIGWTRSGRAVPGVEPATFERLLAESDFVSLHVALTGETRHIIDGAALARMKPDAILVNTGRGPLVDEAALVAALRDKRIGGAALDVFDREPVAADHPLLQFSNVVVAPHIGSATLGTRSAMAQLAVDNLLAGLRSEPMPRCVNPESMQRPRRIHA